jgi:hypothetical protein
MTDIGRGIWEFLIKNQTFLNRFLRKNIAARNMLLKMALAKMARFFFWIFWAHRKSNKLWGILIFVIKIMAFQKEKKMAF